MSEVAKDQVFGISALLALSGDPISLLKAVPQALKTHFDVTSAHISKVILATNVIQPQIYLQSLSTALNTAGNYTAELSACIGTGIASLQALKDLISARTTGLLVVLDDPEEAKGLICAVIATNPVLILSLKGLICTLNSPQTAQMTALDTDLEAFETFMLPWTGSMWKHLDKLVLVTRETPVSELFLALLLRDMVNNSWEYGEIGKIARVLDLSNSHHHLMLDNYAASAWKERTAVSFLEKAGPGNYGLVVQLGELVLAGMQGKVLCLVEGEMRQAAVCQWTVLPHTEVQREKIRQALKPPIGRL